MSFNSRSQRPSLNDCELIFPDFATLILWLQSLPDQTGGLPQSISQTGEQYVEFSWAALARPGNEEGAERTVADQMAREINAYLNEHSGTIYWRIPFEADANRYSRVIRYCDNGPDKDAVTDRRCEMDHDWVLVGAYCRFLRSEKPVIPIHTMGEELDAWGNKCKVYGVQNHATGQIERVGDELRH